MPLPPEILEQIAPHFDTLSRVSSLQVNRLWNMVFTASLWHTITSEYGNPWRRLLKPANYQGHCNHTGSCSSHDGKDVDDEPRELREFRIQQLRKHGHLIRHISLYDSWSIGLLLQAKVVTQLKSLVVFGHHRMAHSGLTSDRLTELAGDVPAHLFNPMAQNPSYVALARACWQLIVNNPQLTSIKFMSNTGESMSFFDTPSASTNTNNDSLLTPTEYIIGVVSNLPRLSHLRLPRSPAEWLFPALANPSSQQFGLTSTPTATCSPLKTLSPLPHLLAPPSSLSRSCLRSVSVTYGPSPLSFLP